jgi:O-antigen ligase
MFFSSHTKAPAFLQWFGIFVSACFPLYLISFSVFGVPLNVPEVLIGIFFVMTISWVWRDGGDFGWTRKFVLPIVMIFTGLAIGLIRTWILFPELRLAALGIVKSWFVVPVIFSWCVSRVFADASHLRKCFDAYMVSALVLAGWAIWQWKTGQYLTLDMRASGPFESANYLALFLGPACVYGALRGFRTFREPLKNIDCFLYWLSSAVLLFALYESKSFGGFLGVFSGLCFYIFQHFFFLYGRSYRRKFWKMFAAVAIFLAFVFLLFFVTSDRGKFHQMFEFQKQSSSSVRLQVWQVTGRLLWEHPLSGAGLGAYQTIYEERAAEILGKPPYEKTMLHTHNVFAMFWVSSGIFGFVGFLLLLLAFFQRVYRFSPSRSHLHFAFVIAAMMMVIVVHGLVDTSIWKNDLSLLFWLLHGVFLGLRE